jgi:hypothetical protein
LTNKKKFGIMQLMHEKPKPLSPDSNESLDNIAANPEVGQNPELADAASAITGIGTVAMSQETDTPVADTGQGFVARRWGDVKKFFKGLDMSNTPAGQAVQEAGVQFSKWDKAKAGLYAMANTVPAVVLAVREGYAAPSNEDANRLDDRNDYAAVRAASGIANPLMRKKLARALIDGPRPYNPVNAHISSSVAEAFPHVSRNDIRQGLTGEVARKADTMRR